ncbi:MAG: metal-dependent transcriptional regulator [Bacteroidetes bacterium]|nr:metal-dependent transcriptional regulator [Bacteroidota bacterium]MCH8035284.1 metal-dependent transcriptional regulator [Bacteroidota bacterium]
MDLTLFLSILKLSLVMRNISKEDYLSTIYRHRNNEGGIKATQLAEQLEISNAAVTDMMKKLSRDGLVNYARYKGIKLTEHGESYARNMIRRHRIWELFLQRIVGMPWDKVHDEAEQLEHSSSDELINRLEEILDYPQFDPHGDPIPDKNGMLPKQKKLIPLSLIKTGEMVEVIRVNDFDNSFLNYLSEIGLELNKKLLVKNILDFDKSMLISIDKNEMNISNTIAANIFVVRENN